MIPASSSIVKSQLAAYNPVSTGDAATKSGIERASPRATAARCSFSDFFEKSPRAFEKSLSSTRLALKVYSQLSMLSWQMKWLFLRP